MSPGLEVAYSSIPAHSPLFYSILPAFLFIFTTHLSCCTLRLSLFSRSPVLQTHFTPFPISPSYPGS